jgi:CDP-4-dehydro-6-deoxyglucose reductase/ferredoxin-NAD(P)+ reductase (naphthalene dioxygenase ferredoxin-specific)
MFCRVVELIDATPDIRIVRLEIVSGGPFRFQAGQYARVTFGEHRPRDYSLGSGPDDEILEFHIRHSSTGGASAYVARELRIGDGVWVEGPYGEAFLRQDHRGPILAIAGGSGLAPIKSIVVTALRLGTPSPIHLYFGARDEGDVYLEDYFLGLARLWPHFHYRVLLSEPSQPTARPVGTPVDAVAADFSGLEGFKAYIAGPPALVEAAVQLVLGLGLGAADVHADPFYSEREMAERAATARAAATST